jgi:hypothetical protein
MRAGLALMVTVPVEVVTVAGTLAAAALDGGLDGGPELAAGGLLELLELQPATSAAAAIASSPARRGVFIGTGASFQRGRKERPPNRVLPGTDHPSHEGRWRLARQEATWLGPWTGRHSCGTAPE